MSNIFNLPSAEQIDELNTNLFNLILAEEEGENNLNLTSWSQIQRIVRSGTAAKVFSIGDQLICQRGGANLVWDVIGIDHDTPSDPQFTHSMTLQLHDCFPTVLQFDAAEAFYYAENGLAAGTYHFAIDSTYDATYNNLTSYQFTLTQAVPAGGQLCFGWSYGILASAAKVTSYASATSTTAIEQVAVSEGTDGTNLGTLTAAGDFSNNLNSLPRVRYGNSNYKESAIRQWLGSSAAAGSVWTPQTKFDRPPSWVSTVDGFMNGMDSDFLTVLGNVTKVTAKNTVYDGGGSDTTTDKFFLLSISEVYAGVEVSGVDEGAPYPYYADHSSLPAMGTGSDSNRIKLSNDTAQYWWLRTTNKMYNHSVRYVRDNGAAYDSRVANDNRNVVAPACNII